MSQDKMLQARDLIKQKRYAEARAILKTVNHPKAQEWLAKLDEIDPEFPEVPQQRAKAPKKQREKSGPGCLKLGFSVGCIAPALFCVGLIVLVVVIVALVQQGEEKATKDAVDRNEGRGTLEEPIATGEWMIFEEGKVRATRLVRPANSVVEEMNMFNDDPPQGTEYVLVWFEIACEKDECHPSIDTDLHLIDTEDEDWEEPLFLVLEDDLDDARAIKGAQIAGWQAFEFPEQRAIQTIRVKWGSEILHTIPPTAQGQIS